MACQWLVLALKIKQQQQHFTRDCWQCLIKYNIGIFLLDTWKMLWLVYLWDKLVKICHLTSQNLHFVPQQDGASGWITVSLFSCCTRTTSYTLATELFNCLYLWGKQALLRAAPVWSIIKYNATWKCIRHETRVWTSHSDFLLVIHFVLVHMLTAAVLVWVFILQAFSALCRLFFFLCLATLWVSGLECLLSAVDIWRAIRSCHVWLCYYCLAAL